VRYCSPPEETTGGMKVTRRGVKCRAESEKARMHTGMEESRGKNAQGRKEEYESGKNFNTKT
jgi:hypothetical protein